MIPLSERAVESGSTSEVFAFLAEELQGELTARLENVKALAVGAEASVRAARAHVEALLNFEVFTHTMFLAMHAGPHGDGTSGHHAPGH
ncbi:hypothetical protein GCM10025788_00100 [Serinicoccus chungangensis]|nr:DUF6448 family protein [Serinicoccus chungangensis]